MDKARLRKAVNESKKNLTEEKYAIMSRGITDKLIRELNFIFYKEFFFYYPLPDEVSLLGLAKQLISLGKRVYFPRVDGDDMEFFRVVDIQKDFKEGAFHVMEPVGNETPKFQDALVFVPGLAFDAQMHRMGHGKGYYDKYLSRHPQLVKVGICSNHFFMADIPVDDHDIAMDCVVTETSMYHL